MRKEIFISITVLKEKMVGKKRYFLRREVSKKYRTQYCIRDGKFNEIFKDSFRPFVEQYWEQYFTMVDNPVNPFNCGDIVYENRDKTKESYDVYQVVKTTKTKVYLRKIFVEYELIPIIDREILVPKKDCFDSDDIIEKQIQVINRNRYAIKLEYGIYSESCGGFKIMTKDKIWVGLE